MCIYNIVHGILYTYMAYMYMYANFPLIFHCGDYYKLQHSTYQSDCVGLPNYFLKLITTASLLHLLREELGSLRGSFTPAPSNSMC